MSTLVPREPPKVGPLVPSGPDGDPMVEGHSTGEKVLVNRYVNGPAAATLSGPNHPTGSGVGPLDLPIGGRPPPASLTTQE